VIADTHLPRRRTLPAECLRLLHQADLIVHAGDFTAEPVLEQLQAFAPVAAVHGNMDDAALRARLPERRVVEAGGARLGLVHDAGPLAGRRERLLAAFPDCRAVVYGHTHLPEVTDHDGIWILNPGSPTERRRAPTRSMLMLDIQGSELSPTPVSLFA
jgi:putative phosphoesterase